MGRKVEGRLKNLKKNHFKFQIPNKNLITFFAFQLLKFKEN